MSEQCPNCLSTRIGKNNYGKKTAGIVGASIGAFVGGASGATAGVVFGDVLDDYILDSGHHA